VSDDKQISKVVNNEVNAVAPLSLSDNGLRAGALIETAVTQLSQEQAQALMAKAAEEALRLESKRHEQNMDYVSGKKAIEDHVDAFNMLDKSGKTTRHGVNSDIKTGAGNMRIESKSGATCFVASVAYDDPNHVDVMYLRDFRDTVLCNSKIGKDFIAWYWRVGPELAKAISPFKSLKMVFRYLIKVIISTIRMFRSN
jgi:hypothetical protein